MDSYISYPSKIKHIPDLLRELLINLSVRNYTTLPPTVVIELGDNIINLLAFLTCNIYLTKNNNISNSNLDGYIVSLLNHGIDAGISFAVLHEIPKIDNEHYLIQNYSSFEEDIRLWKETKRRSRIEKKYKALLELQDLYFDPIIDNFFNNINFLSLEISLDDEQMVFNNEKKDKLSIFPLIVKTNCKQCAKNHLFAFDSFNTETNRYLYKCWGNHHLFVIDNSSKELKNQIQILFNQKYKSKSKVEHLPYYPLFESSYPSMQKLVELLYVQTKPENKIKLWLTNNLLQDTQINPTFVKNKILIDCIEQGPVTVIRNVAELEGSSELPGYLKNILEGKKKKSEEINEIFKTLDQKCWDIAIERYDLPGQNFEMDDNDPEIIKIRNDIYSIEIVKLLNFKIEEIDNASHLEYYYDKINKAIEHYTRKDKVHPDCRKIAKKLFYELETVYKELICFYHYIYDLKIKGEQKPFFRINMLNDFTQLHFELLELHKMFSDLKSPKEQRCFEDLFGKRTDSNDVLAIFNLIKYSEIIAGDDKKKGSLLDLKIALANKGIQNPYLINDKKTYINILNWLKELYEFFLNKEIRIFPYKIIFTVSSEIRPFSDSEKTSRGIKTCQYFTYVRGVYAENKESSMRIYTSETIDFSSYYYCIPHPNRSLDNIWVDPLLVSIKDVGFCDNRQSSLSNTSNVEYYEKDEPYIFISYAHKDFEKIKPVLEFLTKENYRFWFDRSKEGIPLGKNWDDYLLEMINHCSNFIVFISENSTQGDGFVLNEITEAKENGKNIIPIYLEKVKKRPMKINNCQGILKYEIDDETYFKELVTKVKL